MRVLVTGGSGHLGANLVRRLLDEGHEIRALQRRGGTGEALAGLGVEVAWGDLRDAAAVRAAVRRLPARLSLRGQGLQR